MNFTVRLKEIILNFINRILNPDFDKKFINGIRNTGLVFISQGVLYPIFSNITWKYKDSLVDLQLGGVSIWGTIFGVTLIFVSVWLYVRNGSPKLNEVTPTKEVFPLMWIDFEDRHITEDGLDYLGLVVTFNDINNNSGLVDVTIETLKKWDISTSRVLSLTRFNPLPESPFEIPKGEKNSNTLPFTFSYNGTHNELKFNLHTKEFVNEDYKEFHPNGVENGFIVFQLKLSLSSEGYQSASKNILVALHGGFDRVLFGLDLSDVRLNSTITDLNAILNLEKQKQASASPATNLRFRERLAELKSL